MTPKPKDKPAGKVKLTKADRKLLWKIRHGEINPNVYFTNGHKRWIHDRFKSERVSRLLRNGVVEWNMAFLPIVRTTPRGRRTLKESSK